MYSSLPDILNTEGAKQKMAADCQELVGQELSSKSGVSATALKVAYKAVTAFAPGYYQSTVEDMVPHLLERLQPFWAYGAACLGPALAGFGEWVVETTRATGSTKALCLMREGELLSGQRQAGLLADDLVDRPVEQVEPVAAGADPLQHRIAERLAHQRSGVGGRGDQQQRAGG